MIHRLTGRQASSPLAASALAVLLGACELGTDAPPMKVISADLVAAPVPLVRALRLALDRSAPLVVDYWADGVPRLRVRAAAATEHSLLLTQLRPARTYHYEVVGTTTGGTFVTSPLPDDLARITFEATGDLSVPLVMLHLHAPDGFKGYVAVDGRGEVVWYWSTADFPGGMTRRSNGNFVVLDMYAVPDMNAGRGLVEISPAGEVVHELPHDPGNREWHHDVVATPRNTLLAIAFDDRIVDGARLRGEAIWEWTPETGGVVKRWSAWDHFSPTVDRGPRFFEEWMHANALSIGPRGNVLLGVHYWNQIISITPDMRGIEWRLGGVNATVTVPEPDRFSGQHTPTELPGGRVLMFDNGIERLTYSRALELVIEGPTARSVWEWRPVPVNYARIISSARRLSNGRTLVAFGTSAGFLRSTGPIEVYEVTGDGIARWHLVVGNTFMMYRAEPMEAIAGEERVPQ